MGCAGLARKRPLFIPPFSAAPASAGFTPAGATMTLSGNATITQQTGRVPFDTVNQDPHGFADTTNHQFTIPAGLAGLYLYGFLIGVSPSASVTSILVIGNVAGNADNLAFGGPTSTSTNNVGTALGLERFAVGDHYAVSISWGGGATQIIVQGGSNSTQFYMLRVTS